MSQLVQPHGSDTLNILLLDGAEREQALAAARDLPRITLSSRERGDLIMLGIGGFTPLDGFMGKADWQSVCDNMTLANGVFWPIPITLSTDAATADGLAEGAEVALVDEDGDIMGSMTVTEKYAIDKAHECQQVFKTTDEEHPGVKMVMAQGDVNLAGPVKVFSQGDFPEKYAGIYMTPTETRAMFEARGWKTVAAFQTRNPMHRSHEHLAKIAIEICDGVMVHSLLGNLKPGDIPAEVRQNAIKTLIDNYFVENTVVQSGYPLDMRYAGPREALLHALFRQNYGCSHLIVGRDHAGVGDYYGPFDAHHIFDEIADDALITQPLKIDWTFWCDKCGTMASMRTCPHTAEDRVLVSGTKLRKLLSEGGDVPDNFSRPEVLAVLREYYEGLQDHEKVKVELKGHSAR
ncbi:sulfate adenylyltransferase [Alloalcanivorax profundimaris]|uniref:sulfate adenylyltransferase n=1 Tax=Alloalcanivorax profundimaris TaxID=2735259 RepID=UPI000C5A5E89|nr:sulfate adenylyltransferase [Alloalcanivorax profundimaris]MAO58520.1 sulfate adenylyltransferase [Alcanivorax sp.]UWN49006.1 Sulfate adenylyltransferase [Alcanivorax sp. ALC70]MAY09763.1 sulfate adenylyltransferase [Alcanivorax sp.]MBF1800711.1 sulfate adenylyltransferase [Alloalcanivorax profundimaris]MBI56054.1 sulfate adenylyltransferase [Alcanivorax sp.]|tara:strand:+ start:45365 stop:46579 length:1215 start_codon:yes stop_codon:yes gene_type:complete